MTDAEELDAYEPAIDAVVTARRAIVASPTLAAAHFNLALALERVGLTAEAYEAFETAAGLEPSSPWANESRSRAAATRQSAPRSDWTTTERLLKETSDPARQTALILADAHLARVHAEGPYLTNWAKARIDGNVQEARSSLEFARKIGDVLRHASGERLAWDAVAAVDAAEKSGNAEALARAHLVYLEGRLARRNREDERALVHLTKSTDDLARFRSPLQHLARYYMAGALYELGRISDAERVLEPLDAQMLEARGYRGLAAQVGWERGICRVVRGSYAEALDIYSRSRVRSIAIGEHDLAGRFDDLAAEALEYLGQPREAWARRVRALRAYAKSGRIDTRKAVALTTAGKLQIAARNWGRAEALLAYAIPLASEAKDAIVAIHALTQHSVALNELHDAHGAKRDRQEARRWLRQITAPTMRERLETEIDIAEGVAKRVGSPKAALLHFTRAIDFVRNSGQSAMLPRLYFERARTNEILGEIDRQRRDLQAGLEVVATWEKEIASVEQRAAISVWSEAIRRELIALELGAHELAAAFSYADDRLTAADVHAAIPRSHSSLADVQRELAPNAAIIEYVVTPRSMVALIIRSDRVHAVSLPAAAHRIAVAAETLRTADDDAFAARAATLHRLVIAPLLRYLHGVTTLAVVPDKELIGIPFGALRDSDSNQYLAQHLTVIHAPTARVAVRLSRRAHAVNDARLLSIGASLFDQTRYSGIPALPFVSREASEVAALFPRARVLTGQDATPEALRRELAAAEAIHYAGHIIGRGADARLLLAPSAGESSITARDISRLQLQKVKVAVLAGCQGGTGIGDRNAVIADMASGFLAAGVPVVIASSAALDDAKAPATMRRLHALLREEGDAAAAVRRVVLLEQQGKTVPLSLRLLVIGGSRSLVRR